MARFDGQHVVVTGGGGGIGGATCKRFAQEGAKVTVLSTSPGGIAEMSITAKVLQLGVPVVTAFQVCRLVAVLLLVAPMYHRLYGSKTA